MNRPFIECPACGKRASADGRVAGQPLFCVACGQILAQADEAAPHPSSAGNAASGVGSASLSPAGSSAPSAHGDAAPVAARAAAWVTIAVAGGLGVFVGLWLATTSQNERAAAYALTHSNMRPPEVNEATSKPAVAPTKSNTKSPSSIGKMARPAPAPPDEQSAVAPEETRPVAPVASAPPPGPQPPPAVQVPEGRPAIVPITDRVNGLTDEAIGRGIQRGVDYLIRQFDPDRHELRSQLGDRGSYHGGMDALCVYALMQAGQSIPDARLNVKGPFIEGCITVMKQMTDNDGPATYARGIRATALALYNRTEDKPVLRADVKYLLESVNEGAYTYAKINKDQPPRTPQRGPNRPRPQMNQFLAGVWDNSNSQYGLLGVWSGAEAEVEVPLTYWKEVEKHWVTTQLSNGEWGYRQGIDGTGTISMTSAGIASLLVTHDWLDAPKFASAVGREPFSPQLQKGLNWFETGNNAVNIRGGHYGYTMYGVERVGLASGFKFFGTHDWYRELATNILKEQNADGSWGDDSPVDTAYCLLFLARGRHPVLMNKLRFDGFWANRPRDVSNLARYASRQLERPLNWQVVPIDHPWQDWLDSPVLYLASHQAVKLSESDYTNIRQFVQAGGLLFTQADGDAPAFNAFSGELAHKLFPDYEMTDVPPGHPIYSSVYKINPKPPLKMVSNGSRILMLHSQVDISRFWQLRDQVVHKPLFELGVNLFVYAAGKRDLRNRLDSNYVAEVQGHAPSATVQVTRLKYPGNWNPEPYAWTRFSRVFQRATGYGMQVSTIDLRDLKPGMAPIAVMTGNARYVTTAEEVAALRNFVEAGGVVLIDSTGGAGVFQDQLSTSLLAPAFPAALPRPLHASDPILSAGAPGMEDIGHPRLRPYTLETLGQNLPLPDLISAGKGHVIVTSLDITSGLLGTSTWGIQGYEPEAAQSLVKNIVLWTMDGQHEH